MGLRDHERIDAAPHLLLMINHHFFQSIQVCLSFFIPLYLSACGLTEKPLVLTQIPSELTPSTADPTQVILSSSANPQTNNPTALPEFIFAPDNGEPVYPLSKLRILSPGNGSRLSSPIHTELSVILGVENTIEIELLNSSGELLVKKVIRYESVGSDQRILIYPELDFEIVGAEENGRIIIKTYDSFTRLLAMSSCDLTLLSDGQNQLLVAGIPYEAFALLEPASGSVIRGGKVMVSGYARPVGDSIVIFELVDENGKEISNRQLIIQPEPGSSPISFKTTLPYVVNQATPVRLIIRQAKGTFPDPAVATSVLITIE
jgi:hypothetical protein